MFNRSPKPIKFAVCTPTVDDPDVVPHLAFDLYELDELRKKGIPISTSNAAQEYIEGNENCSFDVSLDRVRGVDINDLWNADMDVRRRLSKAQIRNVNVGTK